MSAPTVEVAMRNDAAKCSSVSRDLRFRVFHPRKQLFATVGASEQSCELPVRDWCTCLVVVAVKVQQIMLKAIFK